MMPHTASGHALSPPNRHLDRGDAPTAAPPAAPLPPLPLLLAASFTPMAIWSNLATWRVVCGVGEGAWWGRDVGREMCGGKGKRGRRERRGEREKQDR